MNTKMVTASGSTNGAMRIPIALSIWLRICMVIASQNNWTPLGTSLDVILDTCLARPNVKGTPTGVTNPDYTSCTTPMLPGTYYLYTPNLDHLSNDAENFGGQLAEVRVQ